jgi:hypothetical protein
MMSMMPLVFWQIIVKEINQYAIQNIKQQIEKRNTRRPRLVCEYKWQDVSLQEVMVFFGLLLYGMLYP